MQDTAGRRASTNSATFATSSHNARSSLRSSLIAKIKKRPRSFWPWSPWPWSRALGRSPGPALFT